MNRTLYKLLIVFGVLLLPTLAGAQTRIRVNFTDGTNAEYVIPATDGIYFSFVANDTLLQFESNMGQQSFSVSTVRSIAFPDNNSIDDATLESRTLTLYPNPAKSYITIDGGNDGPQLLTIYSAAGVAVLQGQFRKGDKIDVSQLKRGFYIVKFGTNALKMYKL